MLYSVEGKPVKLFEQIGHIAHFIETMIDEELREKQLIEDMVNVDFSSINQTSTKMHPDWESLLRLTQRKITEELGPEFKLKWDISQYSLYAFPSLSCGIVRSILICNMAVMVVDDKFDKYSIGIKI